MKSIALILIAGIAALSSASALTLASSQYLGSATPGTPSSPGDEAAYINGLIPLSLNTSFEFTSNQFLNRSGNSFGSLPTAVITGATKDEANNPNPIVSVSGWNYVAGKYGKDTYFWYVGGMTGSITLDEDNVSGGLSHVSRYNAEPTRRVPDGGATLVLLGAALSGLGAIRRSSSKKA